MIHRSNTNTNQTDCSFPFLEWGRAFAVVWCCSIGHLFLTMSSGTQRSVLVLRSYVANSLGSAEKKFSWHHKSVCNSVCYLCQSVFVACFCERGKWSTSMITISLQKKKIIIILNITFMCLSCHEVWQNPQSLKPNQKNKPWDEAAARRWSPSNVFFNKNAAVVP